MATSDAGGALPRVARRFMRAAELVVVAAGLYWCFLNLPCAAAAASSVFRVAASFAMQRYLFLAANAFVIVLLAVCHRDVASYSLSPAALLGWWSPDSDAQDQYLPFPGPPLMLPPPTTEVGEEEKVVFEDKKAVHVETVRPQPPRRSRSEKTSCSGGAAGRRREVAPELRRVESENGRQSRRAAPEVSPVEWGMDDEEAFRLSIEAFILKQQTIFQLEESVILKQQTSFQLEKSDAAAATAAAARDDTPVIAGAVVAVK